jgi:hypothetical protein
VLDRLGKLSVFMWGRVLREEVVRGGSAVREDLCFGESDLEGAARGEGGLRDGIAWDKRLLRSWSWDAMRCKCAHDTLRRYAMRRGSISSAMRRRSISSEPIRTAMRRNTVPMRGNAVRSGGYAVCRG